MKSFVISLILLSIVICAVLINSWYCEKICSDLIGRLSQFPGETDSKNISAMILAGKLFDGHYDYFSFILPKGDLVDLACDFSDIFSYYSSGDTPSYLSSLERAKNRLHHIRSSEEISFKEFFGS